MQTLPVDTREMSVCQITERKALLPMPALLPKPAMGGEQAYTPLNVPLRKILMKITNDLGLRWLGKMKMAPEKRSREKYCDFH